MCVIAVQEASQNNLTFEEVRAMCEANPDGFGLMWTDGIKTQYRKGYFNINKFYSDYVKIKENPNTTHIALHCRIGTGSAINGAMCHPFPITANKDRIKRLEGRGDVLCMMNGIIGASTFEFSDTAIYVMNQLKSYYDYDNRFYNHFSPQQERLFENEIAGNRFVFMDSNGVKLFGSGWSSYNGKAKVSNRYWIRNLPTYEYDDGWCFGYYYTNLSKRYATDNSKGRHKSYIDYLEEGLVR